jgi:hypothetical protein
MGRYTPGVPDLAGRVQAAAVDRADFWKDFKSILDRMFRSDFR